MTGMISQEQIDTVVRVVKNVSTPLAVYLFGSYAHGTANPDSDLDIAVIKANIDDQYADAFQIRKTLFGSGISMDLLFIDKKNFDERLSHVGTVYYEIASKGIRLL